MKNTSGLPAEDIEPVSGNGSSTEPSGSVDSVTKSLRVYLEQVPDHGSTTDVVTDALREAILEGALPESTWLREDELAKDLGVSRTPVRDALRRLSDEHLAVRTAHRGTIVAPMRLDDVLAVYTVREVLEGLAARMTANRPRAGTTDELLRVHGQMADAFESGNLDVLPKLNLEFHAILREGSDNDYLQRFLLQIEHAVRRFQSSTFEFTARATEALAEHRAILDAIIASDGDLAAQRAQEHISRAREARIRRLS
ncbi:GntR family transcriptional regulator [Jatrophihabitans sp. DSM 45814]